MLFLCIYCATKMPRMRIQHYLTCSKCYFLVISCRFSPYCSLPLTPEKCKTHFNKENKKMHYVQKYLTALHKRKFNTMLHLHASLLALSVLSIVLLISITYRRIKLRGSLYLPIRQVLLLTFFMYVAPLLAVDGDGRPPPVL